MVQHKQREIIKKIYDKMITSKSNNDDLKLKQVKNYKENIENIYMYRRKYEKLGCVCFP
jgi:hypothetical protein